MSASATQGGHNKSFYNCYHHSWICVILRSFEFVLIVKEVIIGKVIEVIIVLLKIVVIVSTIFFLLSHHY